VPDRPDIYVRLTAFKLFLCHDGSFPPFVRNQESPANYLNLSN
jgi:hypothetical protein